MMKNTKSFPLRTVLVVARARELAYRGVERTGVNLGMSQELIEHIFGVRNLNEVQVTSFTRGRLVERLRETFPRIAGLPLAKVTQQNFDDWMRVQETELGKTVEVVGIGS